jgi:hypothetical protein
MIVWSCAYCIVLWVLMPALIITILISLCSYLGALPSPESPPIRRHGFDTVMGMLLYFVARALAIPRVVFVPAPWLAKRCVALLLRSSYERYWNSYPFQALRLVGEVFHLWLVLAIFRWIVPPSAPVPLTILVTLALSAELLRLVAQRGQMIASALWQALPHRIFARVIEQYSSTDSRRGCRIQPFRRYCAYYKLSDDARLQYILCTLQALAAGDRDTARRLSYLTAFRIVPDTVNLRAGHVRDVARGEVFIHRRWTNDPWLLIGQALRRAPWMFDPRYVPRPFSYRTQAQPTVTRFVLNNTRYSPSYAWYQFGHEIKAASHELGYRALRWLGWDLEPPIDAGGIYPFDRFAWLTGAARRDRTSLWSDAAAITDVRQRLAAGEDLSARAIAAQYTYPLCYVEDVLLLQIAGSRGHDHEPTVRLGATATPSEAQQPPGWALPNADNARHDRA